MRIRTERDARALAGIRGRLADAADECTGGDASREARDRVYRLLCDVDDAFAEGLAWCHADTTPAVRYAPEIGWTIRCEECGLSVSRRTLSEAEEGWNDLVARSELEEGSE